MATTRALPSLNGAARDERWRIGSDRVIARRSASSMTAAQHSHLRPRCAPRPDRTYAEAAVHDAFVAVWKGIDRFDYRADDLSTWVMGFVRRHSGQ